MLVALLATIPVHAVAEDEPARPPLQFDLTHRLPEIMLEETLASVTHSDTQGTTYVRAERLAFEMPLAPARWYVGVGYDAALGNDSTGSPSFVSGNPEVWGRGVWTAVYGLSFGGGFSFVIPTGSYGGLSDGSPAATTAFAAIAARGWDRALYDPDNATFRPFLDVRLVTGPVTVTYRQTLEITSNFGTPAFDFAAVATVFFGVRFSRLVSCGVDLVEYYTLTSNPQIPLDDDQRAYFAVGAHIAFDTRYFRPSIGLMTNIGSPLDAISHIGSPLTTAPTSFVGLHFSLDFRIEPRKKNTRI
jgi:hypothetical protein